MSRKSQLLILAVMLLITVFVIAGCGTKPAAEKGPWKPDKPITIIVPSAPGGGHDNTARAFAKAAEKYAGVPINILNEAAGAGVVAHNKLMQAQPDGYTLGQLSISVVSDQYLVEGAKYNHNNFKYICQIASDPNNLVVKSDGPYGKMSLEEFIDFAKSNPKKIRIGVSGNWTNHDYVRHQFEQATGAELTRVSIKGGSNIVMAILAGDLDAGVPYPSEVQSQVVAGKIKVLAHSGDARLNAWPDVPTFKEKGLPVDLYIWRVLAVPSGTPDEIVQGLYEIFKKTMEDPETKKLYETAGIGFAFKDPADTLKMVSDSHDKYKKIIDEAELMKK